MKVVFSVFPSKPAWTARQVAENLATTFLRDHQPEPACRPTTTTSFSEAHLISHETLNTEDTD